MTYSLPPGSIEELAAFLRAQSELTTKGEDLCLDVGALLISDDDDISPSSSSSSPYEEGAWEAEWSPFEVSFGGQTNLWSNDDSCSEPTITSFPPRLPTYRRRNRGYRGYRCPEDRGEPMRRLAMWNLQKEHDAFLSIDTRVRAERGETEKALEERVLAIDNLQTCTRLTRSLYLRKSEKAIVGHRVAPMKDNLNMRKVIYHKVRAYEELFLKTKVYSPMLGL
ncbi:hypothetical protein H2200_009751 [Cladophialophora chaetospira]|uniref:Uncharacterized protein n=1 Tax=Cladophialophora chaetospira TaxID=386627 RepID=A0AA39CF61_9EURO|nr:hypothetical protein H2200_009751 [Cladophialophora chaetospira]